MQLVASRPLAFDLEVISYEELVRIFFKSHDPTLLNAQGPNHGTRYRSVILYTDENQEKTVETVLEEFKKKRTFREKVVTELSPLQAFYRAEEYHQDYFANHPEQPYFKMIIRPKIGKVPGTFKEFSKVQYPCNEDMHCVEFAIGCLQKNAGKQCLSQLGRLLMATIRN